MRPGSQTESSTSARSTPGDSVDVMTYVVTPIPLSDVLTVRLEVLRRGTPSSDPAYSEDSDPTAVHLGIVVDARPVATSSWYLRAFPPSPDARALQLKGMAVLDRLQGSGAGRSIIEAGLDLARKNGCELVWARARDSALYFYERTGFEVVGDAFIDDATGMSHHLVVRSV